MILAIPVTFRCFNNYLIVIDIRLIELYWILKKEGILMITWNALIYLT